ncbi:phospholipase D-like domain-containing protein [Acinetobacter amyesii]|uniref:phospholipase D-like domain-containing protein n=2 Tax=Acinetobacter TaxID=469 RepID=UPI003F0729F8
MHHKFCIIDLKKVITGSFNWTVKASFNNENIAVIEQREQAEKFADEFIKLIEDLPRK